MRHEEADGTGSWWVKHPIMEPEGHYNWPTLAADYAFGGQYTEGYLLEDGVTMMLSNFIEDNFRGFPVDNKAVAEEIYCNSRTPAFSFEHLRGYDFLVMLRLNVLSKYGRAFTYTKTLYDIII